MTGWYCTKQFLEKCTFQAWILVLQTNPAVEEAWARPAEVGRMALTMSLTLSLHYVHSPGHLFYKLLEYISAASLNINLYESEPPDYSIASVS